MAYADSRASLASARCYRRFKEESKRACRSLPASLDAIKFLPLSPLTVIVSRPSSASRPQAPHGSPVPAEEMMELEGDYLLRTISRPSSRPTSASQVRAQQASDL